MNYAAIPKFKNYKRYKDYLRVEFNYSCVYCDAREPELGGARSFCVEHYKPKSIFSRFEAVYKNLLYACNRCNSYKQNYWPNYREKMAGKIILNPRKDDISCHLDTVAPVWKSKTDRGEWNILKLHLSSPPHVERRKKRIEIESFIEELKNEKARLSPEEDDLNGCQLLEKLTNRINTFKSMISGQMD